MRQGSMQFGAGMTPMVKRLLIANVGIWIVFVVIGQKMFMDHNYVFHYFGMKPVDVLFNFWIWQPLTYMFLHSSSPMHVVFNMLIVWMMGAELEQRWGSRFFLLYYLVSGVGAALIYLVGALVYLLVSQDALPLEQPLVGASGAVFGLLLAYGIVFGERTVLFFFLFPMKAKHMMMIIGAVELVSLVNTGMRSDVANLAHLGGLVAGFLFLWSYTRWKTGGFGGGSRKGDKKRGRRLKLVVDNEKGDSKDGPKYWN